MRKSKIIREMKEGGEDSGKEGQRIRRRRGW